MLGLPLVDELQNRNFYPRVCTFKNVKATLKEFRPGIVVLDLLEGSSEVAGNKTYKWIWETRFCPIVIYSAEPDRIESDDEHPFITKVQKGSGSEFEVAKKLASFAPTVQALETVSEQVNNELQRVLRRVAPKLPKTDGDLLARVGRRRLAATFDTELSGAPLVGAWEQYIYPPIHNHLVTGDILRKRGADWNSPEAYRVVLTPTCDLVDATGRSPKVGSALVAKCSSIAQLDRKGERLKSILQSGFDSRRQTLIVPGFDQVLPHMLAEMRSLELIELDQIEADEDSCDEHEFCRVVSIDSPFRELVTWCYLHVTGRPGLPERNVTDWADEIKEEREKRRGS